MVERIIKLSRRISLIALFGRLGLVYTDFRESLRELFPFFLAPQFRESINFEATGDHLFLPESMSAKTLMRFETLSLLLCGGTLSGALVWIIIASTPFTIGTFFITIIALLYALLVVFKLSVVAASPNGIFERANTEAIAALSNEELPIYTVIVPLREEAAVMPQIVASLSAIDYPAEKLDLIITLEKYDHETREAIYAANAPATWRIVTLPDTAPKTKPKALNVAFKHIHGEHLVIYDAEIIPDRDQLKQAVLAFRARPDIACFQTRLDHYNTDQSIMTKLFTTEFTFYYDIFLRGLAALRLPIPLSGHSTHFRTNALRAVGAWDPYNVAEDCDIGMRLYRAGYKSGMIDSFSQEEATATVDAWIRQRTRWMKGFIQTSIVQLRHPRTLMRELGGLSNFLAFLMLVPGMVFYCLLNVVTWIVFIAWVVSGSDAIKSLYPMPVLYLSTAAFVVGAIAFIFLNLLAVYRRGKARLVRYWFLTPIYWMLLSFAAMRAVWQLARTPHLWEKTAHGTHLAHPPQ